MTQTTCAQCDNELPARKPGSGRLRKYCSTRCSRKANRKPSTRTCTVDHCSRAHVARGLCSTHYNQQHYTTDQRHTKATVPCTTCGTLVVRGINPRRRPTCSVACRTALQWGTMTDGSEYDWTSMAMSRAARQGASVIEPVNRTYVLERDRYTCYLCGTDTSLATSPYDDNSPTVDHVIPLSKGGEHSIGNTRCACLHCNSSKQDTTIEALVS